MAKMALMPKSNVIASTNTSFAILDTSVIIANTAIMTVMAIIAVMATLAFWKLMI